MADVKYSFALDSCVEWLTNVLLPAWRRNFRYSKHGVPDWSVKFLLLLTRVVCINDVYQVRTVIFICSDDNRNCGLCYSNSVMVPIEFCLNSVNRNNSKRYTYIYKSVNCPFGFANVFLYSIYKEISNAHIRKYYVCV